MLASAVAATAGDQEPLNELGVVLLRLGEMDEARRAFERLLDADPTAAGTWFNVGLLEMGARRPAAAAVAFRRVVDLNPRHVDAWRGLGAALAADDTTRAAEAWQRVVELDPRDFDTLYNLGMLLTEANRRAEALPYLRRFLAEAPRDRYSQDLPRVRALLARTDNPFMKRRLVVALLIFPRQPWCGGIGASSGGQPLPVGALRGYNVLLVTIDTLRVDRVGAYGHSGGLTPTLDRLAAEGLRFDVRPRARAAHAAVARVVDDRPDSTATRRARQRHLPARSGAAAAGGCDQIRRLSDRAFIGAFVLDARFGLARGFDVYDDRYGERPSAGRMDVVERLRTR